MDHSDDDHPATPTDRDWHDEEPGRWPDRADVVVIGAGLAGLTAAAAATRAGARAVVLDAHSGGGRAAVRRVALSGTSGAAVFNDGPRALYLGGPGHEVLRRLGIRPRGHKPPTRGSRVSLEGRIDDLPVGLASLGRSGVVPGRAKPTLVAALAALMAGRPASARPDEPASAWIRDQSRGRDDVAALVAALFRVATYTADLDQLSAAAAVPHVARSLRRGVLYLDGGFEQLLDSLRSVATGADAPVAVHRHVAVSRLEQTVDGGWEVQCRDGRTVRAGAVVVAAGGPAVAADLLDLPELVDRSGPPATAACLELAVAGPVPTRFVLGVDEPLYLSEHSPPADLAPDGVRVVHVARYGATGAVADRARLESLASAAGIDPGDVVARRFLRRMVVQTAIPSADNGGLVGRPRVAVPDRPGAFLAGDWVGPVGMLADASLASGEAAGSLAAEAVVGGAATVRSVVA
ncbi:MAG: FAD-dependent oxidoreductase [Acidimicrobiales bacterium]